MKIIGVWAREILDSRGNPTVEAAVELEDGTVGEAAVPSGASTGKHEAVELRDKDPERFKGKGVRIAVQNVEEKIAKELYGLDAFDQRNIDDVMIKLDGTENKSNLGANALLSVSLACARAESAYQKKPLYQYLTRYNKDFNGRYIMPVPLMNVLNGGAHANWTTDIQEYMILPVGAKSVAEAVRIGAEVYQKLKEILTKKNLGTGVGDEGGFAPQVLTNEEPFSLLVDAIEEAGYKAGKDVVLAIDAAASEFFHEGKYNLKKEGKALSGEELSSFYSDLIKKFPIVSFEDAFDQDDWDSWKKFNSGNNKIQIVGDDLYTTNIKRMVKGIDVKASNSILIKLNQIGTLSETIDAIFMAKRHNFTAVISHRSGETEDAFIADLAVAMGTGQIKSGAPARSERMAKYNRLMEIEQELGEKAVYAQFPF